MFRFNLKKTSVAVHEGWITDGYAMFRTELVELIGDDELKRRLLVRNASFYHEIPDGRNSLISQYKRGINETVKSYSNKHYYTTPYDFTTHESGALCVRFISEYPELKTQIMHDYYLGIIGYKYQSCEITGNIYATEAGGRLVAVVARHA